MRVRSVAWYGLAFVLAWALIFMACFGMPWGGPVVP